MVLSEQIQRNFSYKIDYAIHNPAPLDNPNMKTHQYECDHCNRTVEFRPYYPHNEDKNIETELQRHLMSCREYKEGNK